MKCFVYDRSKTKYHNMECPECGKKLRNCTYYDRYDECTDETYRVYCKYHDCECGYMDASNDVVRGKFMEEAREKRWGEIIASQIKSFKDIEDKFFNRNQVLKMIRNSHLDKKYACNKSDLVYHLDYWCIHFVLWGHKYYLKKSVDKYLKCRNGLFPIKNGF
ncbi:MAG: hypothetical protein IKP65_07615 [Alphaproteobacteria bacterium]|nr:hypothetical protein [Alphaproteobacteria bacterium]